jgi:hypothetical protein
MRNPILIVLLTFCCVGLFAQNQMTLKQWSESDDATFYANGKLIPILKETRDKMPVKSKVGFKMKGYMFEDGRGMVTDYTKLKLKKVAIISFATGDYNFVTETKGGSYYERITVSLKQNALDSIHRNFMVQGTREIQTEFKKAGIECLSADEMITATKNNPGIAAWKPSGNIISRLSGKKGGDADKMLVHCISDEIIANRISAEEEFIYKDSKGANSYGQLAKDLGVDAVILVTGLLNFDDDENLVLTAIAMDMYGPNPTPKQDKKYIGFNGTGYNEGQHYAQVRVSGNGALISTKGDEVKEKNSEGKKVTVYKNQKFSLDGSGKAFGRVAKGVLTWLEINKTAQAQYERK